VNMGIGIVTPAQYILETMNHPKLKAREDKLIEERRRKDLPSMDSDHIPVKDAFTKQDFEAALRKVSKRLPTSQSDEEK